MYLRILLIIACFSILSKSTAQPQLVKPSLPSVTWEEKLMKAQRTLREIRVLRDSLESYSIKGIDSINLEISLDTVVEGGNHPSGILQLEKLESQLQYELREVRLAMTKGLLPAGMEQLLKELEMKSSGLSATTLKDNAIKLREYKIKLDKHKRRFGEVKSLQELEKKNPLLQNGLKGRPWNERLEWGVLFQVGRQDAFNVDVSPIVSWRLTDLFSIGGAFQYRLRISKETHPWIANPNKVMGGLLFFDVRVKDGFFGRLHIDRLQAPDLSEANGHEQSNSTGITGLAIGLGKSYDFFKNIEGYAVGQYNLLHKNKHTPYVSAFQVKVGFKIKTGKSISEN